MRIYVANESMASPTSGVGVVVEAYRKHLPALGVEYASSPDDCDLIVSHVIPPPFDLKDKPYAIHSHGLYWTGDGGRYEDSLWNENSGVISSLRMADGVSVPSEWVADVLRRDMHLSPYVIPHGVDTNEWVPSGGRSNIILWNKNRISDACDPSWVTALAQKFPAEKFVTTFSARRSPNNVRAIGLIKRDDMRELVQRTGVYLATTKETFGIGILEAMACEVPVLAFNEGGATSLVRHMESGYLAEPGNLADLVAGLKWCMDHSITAGRVGREIALDYSWRHACRMVRSLYEKAIASRAKSGVSIVIPLYNKESSVERSILSAVEQKPDKVIVVDNKSTDNSLAVANSVQIRYPDLVTVISCEKKGVAHARNAGIEVADTRYICCLDADDALIENFIEVCVEDLEKNREIGASYTRLVGLNGDGSRSVSQWPMAYSFDSFTNGHNQVPTCCVFRKELWERIGGYRQRYAPDGAGAEDAEFFLRMGARGYKGHLIQNKALFLYSLGVGQVSGNPNYREVNWRHWHGWTRGARLPFAAPAITGRDSLPVRSFDRPLISVIIPCAKHHVEYLHDALDSVEAQGFEDWEVIVLCDGFYPPDRFVKAYPFVRWTTPFSEFEAGVAAMRNYGAHMAKSKDLLFLDADDFLDVDALATFYKERKENPDAVIYGDYVGIAHIDKQMAAEKRRDGTLLGYYERDGYAAIAHKSPDYDCVRAQRQPSEEEIPYIWCLVTSLVPRDTHLAMNGFDEQMKSWEDWDYWIRIAQSGKCFVHVDRSIVNYRFFTGSRRELGRQIALPLLSYMVGKRGKIMACGGCGGKKHSAQPSTFVAAQFDPRQANTNVGERVMSSDLVMIQLNDGNFGTHSVVGSATRTNYGYRVQNEQFLVHMVDVEATPQKFIVVNQPHPEKEEPQVQEPGTHSPLDDPASNLDLPLITAAALRKNGIDTVGQAVNLGLDGLIALHGIGERSATLIMEAAKEYTGK